MKWIHPILGQIEKLLIRKDVEPGRPPVFIIGAPRSGTTLLYQALVNHYTFAYFTNYTAPFYRAPVIGFWLAKKLGKNRPNDRNPGPYQSTHGLTQGPHGPHECGEFWYRWFPRGEHVYVAKGETSQRALRQLRAEVMHISESAGASMLIKNVYNSMRIAPILEAIPEAAFLVCHRDPATTARSILRCRMDTLGTKEEWFSFPPKEIDQIKPLPYWEQVVEQVYYTYNQVEQDQREFDGANFLHVHYESFCQDVHAELRVIESFLKSLGVETVPRDAVPPSFPISESESADPVDDQRIRARVNELWNQG